MSVHTTTYIHVHEGDDVAVKAGSSVDESGAIVNLGATGAVALFFDRTSALTLARGILARYGMPAERIDVDDMYPEEQDAYWGYAH